MVYWWLLKNENDDFGAGYAIAIPFEVTETTPLLQSNGLSFYSSFYLSGG